MISMTKGYSRIRCVNYTISPIFVKISNDRFGLNKKDSFWLL